MKFRITYACKVCGHQWRKVVSDLSADDPPCPNLACGAAQTNIGMDYTSNRAPAAVGMSNSTKAIDETARIVQEDYGYTNLRDDVRLGETMAPKLPPAQQARADAMFGGGKKRRENWSKAGYHISPMSAGAMGAAAIRGAYSPAKAGADPVQMLHDRREKPPVNIIASDTKT